MVKKESKKKEEEKDKSVEKKDEDILTDKELRDLIEKDIKWSQVIYKQNKKIKTRMTMLVVGNYLRLLLIFVPIILGLIFLIPVFNSAFQKYEPYFERLRTLIIQSPTSQTVTGQISGKDIDTLIKELQEYKQSAYEAQQEN
ncbi:MAG: hypothetical protein ABII02_04345 [Candidatus Magasanikbacteria bacterium]